MKWKEREGRKIARKIKSGRQNWGVQTRLRYLGITSGEP